MIGVITGSSTPDSWSWLAGPTNRRIANARSSTSAKDPKRAFEAPCCDHSTRFYGRLCWVSDRAPNVPPAMVGAAKSRQSTRTHAMLSSKGSTIIGVGSNLSSVGAATEGAVSTEQFATPRSYSEEHTSELQSQFHLVCRL